MKNPNNKKIYKPVAKKQLKKIKNINHATKNILNSSQSEKILFIGAHPDDIELGCSGSLLNHIRRNDDVYVVVFSKGEKGLNEKTEDRSSISKQVYLKCGVLEKNIFMLNIPDTKFLDNRGKIFKIIEKICIDLDINKVFTHTNKEYHQDHIVIHEETLRAARNVQNILTYESNAHTYPTFSPTYFIDITDYIETKISIINKHISQKDKKYCEAENIRSLAKLRGYQSRTFKFSEAFEIIRILQK